jgi:monofunctional glycosyltransferase
MLIRVVKLVGQIISALLLLSIVITLVFRWVPIPFSALMLIRSSEMQAAGKPLKMEYRWVALSEISPNLQKAVIAAEDQRFYQHSGFDLEAIEKAVEHNKVSKAKRGASTISQQTAKNLYLWPGRSWLRKGLEAYFTAVIELLWPKDRILEAYLNIAEWGDGVYGAEQAARRYFDKTADKLTLLESARLAACLPSPRKWNPKRPNGYVIARAGLISFAVKKMEANKLLDEIDGGMSEIISGASEDEADSGEETEEPVEGKRKKLRLGKDSSANADTTQRTKEPTAEDTAEEQ